MELYKKFRNGNKVLKISLDSENDSPREWSNLFKMACFHKRHNLPNESDLSLDSFNNFDEMEKYLKFKLKAMLVTPIFMYDHSGLTIATKPFGSRWDSGQIGFIYTTKEDIKKWFNSDKVSLDELNKAEVNLNAEIKAYDQYLTGEIYRFELVEEVKCDCCKHVEEQFIDGCGGFYGSDFKESCLFDHAGIKDEDIDKWVEVEE